MKIKKENSHEGESLKITPLYEYLKEHPDYKQQWKVRYDPAGNFRAYYNPEFGRIYVGVIHGEKNGEKIAYDQPMIEEVKAGLIICPYYKKGKNIYLGLVTINRPAPNLENSVEFPRCFGEPGKDIVIAVNKRLKKEAEEVEIINYAEGGRVCANTTFFKTSVPIIFAEIKPGKNLKENFVFYRYPEEIDELKENNRIKCALTLAGLSLFDVFYKGKEL